MTGAKTPRLIRRLVSWSRFIIIVAVVGLFVAFVALMASFAVTLVQRILEALGGELSQKELVSVMVQEADVALLATVVYVIALGLYSLFVDDDIPMPAWLRIHTLSDLKNLLASVVVVVLAVLFLGLALTWDGSDDLLSLGLSVGAVIASLSFFLWVSHREAASPTRNHSPDTADPGEGERS